MVGNTNDGKNLCTMKRKDIDKNSKRDPTLIQRTHIKLGKSKSKVLNTPPRPRHKPDAD